MRKRNFLKTVGISTLVMASSLVTSTHALPPVFINNVAEDVYVSIIDFGEGSVTMEISSDREEYLSVNTVALQYGPLTDYQLYKWQLDRSSGANTEIVNSTPQGIAGGFFRTDRKRLWIGYMFFQNKPLTDNIYDRMEYYVSTSDNDNPRIWGRADYSRCTKSSVFLSGLATQCRAEKIGDGMLQYQPYDSRGNRLEIPADEDAILTANTVNWRAEPGDWEDSWYNQPSEPTEPEPTEPNEPTEPEPTEPKSVEPSTETIPTELVELEPTGQTDSAVLTSVEYEDNIAPAVLADYVTIVSSDSSENYNAEQAQDQAQSQSDQISGNSPSYSLPEENIEVPILDKESGNNWLAPVLIISGLAMAAVAWWLLFFGKRKLTDGKEEESVD